MRGLLRIGPISKNDRGQPVARVELAIQKGGECGGALRATKCLRGTFLHTSLPCDAGTTGNIPSSTLLRRRTGGRGPDARWRSRPRRAPHQVGAIGLEPQATLVLRAVIQWH